MLKGANVKFRSVLKHVKPSMSENLEYRDDPFITH